MKITGSLIVCAAAALFTAGTLLLDDGPSTATPAAVAPSAQAQIDIRGFAFTSARVAPGATVVVTNNDAVAHTVSSSAFDTGTIPAGRAVSFVAPATPGTYQFICEIHPSMTGQLVVG